MAGLLNLPVPFSGDQALFTIAARELATGEVLYRDFWDLKQPGIFWFYQVGGSLLGMNEIGIHAFELAYFLCFAVVMLETLPRYFSNPKIATLTPVFTIGMYYAVSGPWHLTQLEALAGFPIFLSLWATTAATVQEARRAPLLLLSGIAGGIVLLYKLPLLPIVGGIWFVGAVFRRKDPWRTQLRSAAWIASGALLPLAAAVFYLLRHGVLDLALWTSFVYPVLLTDMVPRDPTRLLRGLDWFIRSFNPLMVMAPIGAIGFWRHRRDPMGAGLLAWVALGFVAILLQLWWEYHFLLLVVPLGILCAKGFDVAWAEIPGYIPRRALGVSALLLFAVPLTSLANKARHLWSCRLCLEDYRLLEYQEEVSLENRLARESLASIQTAIRDGDELYVLGDPLIAYFSGRRQPTRIHGWSPEQLTSEQWQDLVAELSSTLPAFVFVQDYNLPLVNTHSPELASLLSSRYYVFSVTSQGSWYHRSESS